MCSQETIVSQLRAVKLSEGTIVETEFRRFISEKVFLSLTEGLSSPPTVFETQYFPNFLRVITQEDGSRSVEVKKSIMFRQLLGWKFSVDTEMLLSDAALPTEPASATYKKTTTRFTLKKEGNIVVTCNRVTQDSDNNVTFSVEVDWTGPFDDLSQRFISLLPVLSMLQGKIGVPWSVVNETINKITGSTDSRSSLARPENLTREYIADHLLLQEHVISVKVDGFTGVLIIEGGSAALCRLGEDAKIVHGNPSSAIFSTNASVMVGEIVERESSDEQEVLFYPFDLINAKSHNLDYMERLKGIRKVRESLGEMKNVKIVLKSFCRVGSTRESLASVFEKIMTGAKTMPVPTDGVIFTSLKSPPWGVSLPSILKWKPWEKLTIDFKIDDHHHHRLMVFDGASATHVPFPVKDLKIHGVPDDIGDKVVEMAPVREEDGSISFTFVRFREDKSHANSMKTASNVWKDIKNPIPESTLLGKDLSMLFFVTNIMKKNIIGKIPRGAIVVDIGSGKGGDLMKYEHQGVSHVIAVEPNEENRTFMEERLKLVKTKTQWTVVPCGGEDTDIITEALKKVLEAVKSSSQARPAVWASMMLSMSFFWKDEDTLDSLKETLSAICELSGGLLPLVFCTVEGQRVKKLLLSSSSSDGGIDTDVLKMSFTEDSSRGVGIKGVVSVDIPGSIVKNQTEYLVDLKDLGVDEEEAPLNTFAEIPHYLKCLTKLEQEYALTTVSGTISFTI